ncbi:hypothetical protein JQ615_40530 [Bradyrhizobium jicamae]|uniref:HIG1 domain-containing protein n=1 Tax=Bradyrhizobium jicamae TaxID=280332 RepID=A0ABS5FXS4_9BRAD|nr:hypothetical protein [Bradyrhizobium jicamae]MBR0801637.1 hypothetical protein [Bradyrhizobium jicamae]
MFKTVRIPALIACAYAGSAVAEMHGSRSSQIVHARVLFARVLFAQVLFAQVLFAAQVLYAHD